MKEIKNVVVYKCDHCEKKLFRKHAMVNHEIKCSSNPLNIRDCFDCPMLEVVDIKYEPEPQTYDNDLRDSRCFRCSSKKVFMYPPKMEHSAQGLPTYVEFNNEEITQERMPISCNIKQSQDNSFNGFWKTISEL
jgi:DNA-directed RNA polymerase subunit RPC12/RpoP